MSDLNNTFRLKGLDGMRCIGTLIVFFYHLERGKDIFGMPASVFQKYTGLGQSVMTFFFVLSGFLIFYLLFKEKNKTGTISIGNFYKKRMARIWPVYYIVLFTSILFFENSNLFNKPDLIKHTDDLGIVISLYFFHMPNFHAFFSSGLIAVGHLWSLGVEEQFYTIAPWIIKKTKTYLKVFIMIIFLKIAFKMIFALIYRFVPMPHESMVLIKHIERFLYKLRFEAFALGGIAAYLLIEKKDKILEIIYRPKTQVLNIVLLLLTIPFGKFSESIQVIYALGFAIMILNIVGNKKSVFMPDSTVTNYIGRISYGMYMYQIPVIYLVLGIIMPHFKTVDFVLWNCIYYITSVALCVIVSSASYELMEKHINAWAHKK